MVGNFESCSRREKHPEKRPRLLQWGGFRSRGEQKKKGAGKSVGQERPA